MQQIMVSMRPGQGVGLIGPSGLISARLARLISAIFTLIAVVIIPNRNTDDLHYRPTVGVGLA